MKGQVRIQQFKSLGRRFAGTALLFSGLVGLGTSLVLLLASCAGYLSYSDRPGPGWIGAVHWPSWAEFSTYLGFAPWFTYFCFIFGLGFFGLSLALGFASAPQWLNRLIGGVIAAMAAGLAVMAAGWYIALTEIGPDAAVVLGLAYGVFFFPRFIQPRAKPVFLWLRIGTVASVVVLFVYWIAFPFLPKKTAPNVNYDVTRVTPGDGLVDASSFLGAGLSSELASLRLRGATHGGIGGTAASTGDAQEIDVQLIAFEPISREARLAIPKSGHVVYLLQRGKWTPHPSISEEDGRVFTVEPGANSQFDGGRIKFGKEAKFNDFTWYPVIPKGQ